MAKCEGQSFPLKKREVASMQELFSVLIFFFFAEPAAPPPVVPVWSGFQLLGSRVLAGLAAVGRKSCHLPQESQTELLAAQPELSSRLLWFTLCYVCGLNIVLSLLAGDWKATAHK